MIVEKAKKMPVEIGTLMVRVKIVIVEIKMKMVEVKGLRMSGGSQWCSGS